MKKVVSVVLILVTALMLVSCGEANTPSDSAAQAGSTSAATEATKAPKKAKVDVDLSKLNFNMLYSQWTNIVNNYPDYLGKTIKMNGKFAVYPGDGRSYYVCYQGDATGCCIPTFEFVTPDGKYPLQEEAWFTVTGKLESYYEGTQLYLQLADAVIE